MENLEIKICTLDVPANCTYRDYLNYSADDVLKVCISDYAIKHKSSLLSAEDFKDYAENVKNCVYRKSAYLNYEKMFYSHGNGAIYCGRNKQNDI